MRFWDLRLREKVSGFEVSVTRVQSIINTSVLVNRWEPDRIAAFTASAASDVCFRISTFPDVAFRTHDLICSLSGDLKRRKNGEDGAKGIAVDLKAVLVRFLNLKETEGALGAQGAMRNGKRGWRKSMC